VVHQSTIPETVLAVEKKTTNGHFSCLQDTFLKERSFPIANSDNYYNVDIIINYAVNEVKID